MFLYAILYINIHMQTHYQKYKETIKKVARRNYSKRVSWINKHLSNLSCQQCGESETICLKFHQHDADIRKKSKVTGINTEGREDILKLIQTSKILCHNCWIKLDNDLIELL